VESLDITQEIVVRTKVPPSIRKKEKRMIEAVQETDIIKRPRRKDIIAHRAVTAVTIRKNVNLS
jgi:hypothetical protein